MKFIIKRAAFFSAAFLFSLVLNGCYGKLGYSVVLWNNPEHNLTDGTVCKVHIKSNILQVYVISVPGSKEKIEVPLWQLTEPASKRKTLKTLARLSDFEHTYASVKLDGLPIRAEAVNTAKQVYRLREGEIIRCLYRTNGAAVTNGKGNMSGEWLRVLTSSGTQGWCFSHNLDIFKSEGNLEKQEKTEDLKALADSQQILEKIIETSEKRWYPDYYVQQIRTQKIDLRTMDEDYGLYISLSEANDGSGSISIRHPLDSENWNFEKISRALNGNYVFEGAKVEITLKNNGELIAQYVGDDGKTKSLSFVSLEEDVVEVIQNEVLRRENELQKIASAGPVFKSSNYGTIEFKDYTTLTWKNFHLLVPTVINRNAQGTVTLSIEYFIADNLKSSYDGVITMHFREMEDEVNFLYKLTENGLRLEDATHAVIKNGVITGRSQSPMVLFFEKK